MNLHNFESCIDKKIVARGHDYYKNDCVISVEETERNAFFTFIHGDAKLFLMGDIEIDKLLMKFKDNLPSIQEKTREVFYKQNTYL
ncbi:MAG: hypothetical protein AAGU75_09595 [Bacillota bacterium]